MGRVFTFSGVLQEVYGRFATAPLSFGHGTDNAWDEAVALLVAVTGLPDTKSSLGVPLTPDQVAKIRNLAQRRVEERRPLAYLLGKARYCGEHFHVPEGVMVPRSPIGPWLMGEPEKWIRPPARILDLCCGSGCLGILAAKRFPNASVVRADVDPLALSTARWNIVAQGLEDRVETRASDLFGGFLPSQEFELILCNPPYVDACELNALPPEYAWEPALGLDGGNDGLTLMNRVIEEVSGFLAEGGALIGEVGEGVKRLEARWPDVPFFWPDLPSGGTGVFLLAAEDTPKKPKQFPTGCARTKKRKEHAGRSVARGIRKELA